MGEEDGNREPSDELQESVCTEARLTLNQQLSRIEMYDRKAVGLFRSNILLAGVLLSGLTIAIRTDGIQPGEFLNIWGGVGVFSLGVSTVLCAMAYTSSSYAMRITPNVIENVERDEYDTASKFNEQLRDLYKGWLNYNRNTGDFNSYLITFGIILLMNSIVYFIGAVVAALTSLPQLPSIAMFLIVSLFVIIADIAVYFAEMVYKNVYDEFE